MTEAEYTATPARTGKPFTFTRIRGGASVEFLPGEGSRLHFANRATDTLEVVGVPAGFLLAGDVVAVSYLGTQVFRGEVDTRVKNLSRGDDATETVTVTGPWAKMARLVFRQWWKTGSGYKLSSRLILNQAQDGTAQSLNVALTEIAWGSNNTAPNAGSSPSLPGGWGYQVGTISVSTQKLPFDPTRDITIADAIVRELKYYPGAISRFDYSTTPPTLNIRHPDRSGNDAAYVASIPKTARQYVYNAHPVTGVDLEIETTGEVDGVTYRDITHQQAGDTSAGNPNCLYATVQLAGWSSSSVKQSFTAVSETIPTTFNVAGWWKAKHPRLANVADEAISITNSVRSGAADANDYPYISGNSIGDIQAAGLRARVETWTCDCTIATDSSKHIGLKLSMQFVTTNAINGKTYTWVTESSATSGETMPSGLAAAILAQRSGELKEERFTMRLGTAAQWPTLGDRCDHLVLQEFDVDCATLTAELHFGTPDYLSPDDMAALMTGFRNKARAEFSTSRVSGKPGKDGDAEVEMGGVKPLSSTEWAPGVMAKNCMTNSVTVGGGSGNTVQIGDGHSSMTYDTTGAGANLKMYSNALGKINLDTTDIPASDEIKIRTLTVKGANNSVYLIHIPMCRDVELDLKNGNINISGGGADGDTPGDDPEPEPIPLPEPSGGGGSGGMFEYDPATGVIKGGRVLAGRKWYQVAGLTLTTGYTGYVVITVTHTQSSVSCQMAASSTAKWTNTDTYTYFTIYSFSGGEIVEDWRGAPCVQLYEG